MKVRRLATPSFNLNFLHQHRRIARQLASGGDRDITEKSLAPAELGFDPKAVSCRRRLKLAIFR